MADVAALEQENIDPVLEEKQIETGDDKAVKACGESSDNSGVQYSCESMMADMKEMFASSKSCKTKGELIANMAELYKISVAQVKAIPKFKSTRRKFQAWADTQKPKEQEQEQEEEEQEEDSKEQSEASEVQKTESDDEKKKQKKKKKKKTKKSRKRKRPDADDKDEEHEKKNSHAPQKKKRKTQPYEWTLSKLRKLLKVTGLANPKVYKELKQMSNKNQVSHLTDMLQQQGVDTSVLNDKRIKQISEEFAIKREMQDLGLTTIVNAGDLPDQTPRPRRKAAQKAAKERDEQEEKRAQDTDQNGSASDSDQDEAYMEDQDESEEENQSEAYVPSDMDDDEAYEY